MLWSRSHEAAPVKLDASEYLFFEEESCQLRNKVSGPENEAKDQDAADQHQQVSDFDRASSSRSSLFIPGNAAVALRSRSTI